MTREEIEKAANVDHGASPIGPIAGWWCKKGGVFSVRDEPDVEAELNIPRYSFATLLNWLNANRILTEGKRASDGWIVTIRKSGKGFWAGSKADAIGKVVKYVLEDEAHLWESREQ